jgi:hypothetical protein
MKSEENKRASLELCQVKAWCFRTILQKITQAKQEDRSISMYNQIDGQNQAGGTHSMKRAIIGDMIWLLLLLVITAFFILPQTQQVFIQWTSYHPYLMGFIKFAILATMGELLAIRLATRTWKMPDGLFFKILVWGLIGVMITFMFSFYSAGVSSLFGQGNRSFLSRIILAFLTSAIMNLTFGIVFMAMHRMTDTYIEMWVNHEKPSIKTLIATINWENFISFVVFKTIPLFWIPAHTVTFLLPPQYRVVAAAYLSIILGVILVSSHRRHQKKVQAEDIAK